MSLMLEPSPEQIKEEEIIQNNGFVRLKNLRWLKRFLDVCQIIQKLVFFQLCGLSTAVIKTSKPVLRKFPITGEQVLTRTW